MFSRSFKFKFIESYELLHSSCDNNVIMHCLTVSLYAYEIASKIKQKNDISVDLDLIILGALLHDIGRSKTHSISHGVEGAKILKKYNYNDKIIRIAETHIGAGIPKNEAIELNLPPKDYLQNTLEEQIVAHADNLISGIKIVRINDVIDKFKKNTNENHPSINRIINLNKKINDLIL
ncbi:TIGR00295 family protein [Methanococcus aeolicus]|uniref:TIGR00295 family protein n=1 Tax=Methanococcus aeolicus TaxID=42879 RepID=UPI0022B3E859|nr:TIGR00295 family protein [Methanococcus aeolicus]